MKIYSLNLLAGALLLSAAALNPAAGQSSTEKKSEPSSARLHNKHASGTMQSPNMLSSEEKKEGWKLLFNGVNSEGWRGVYQDKFPAGGWEIKDGEMSHLKAHGGESVSGGDIVTGKEYSNFELKADFKITEGANSGIKYFVVETQPKPAGSAIGLEFQILDDAKHPDAKLGKNGNRTIGSLYDLIPAAADKLIKPLGEWNTACIYVKGNHVEHWLNGKKTVEYERGSDDFKLLVAGSKFKDKPGFGEWPKGHILLQDHGDEVHFRNIKIKEL